MPVISHEEAEVQFADGDAELRTASAGDMMVTFVRAPQGADFRPALAGLPGGMCGCPHWGYMQKGRIRMHTPDGAEEYKAGDVFYWAPSHAPEALEDSEYVDFSPPDEFRPVLDHIKAQ